MTNPIVAAYAEGYMYPSPTLPQPVPQTISQLKQSGFTEIILCLFHVGGPLGHRYGDIVYNNIPIISSGQYIGDATWPNLINTMTAGSIATVGASFGGGGVQDYQTISYIYYQNGKSFAGTNLEQSFRTLAQTFPAIEFIDLDCEDLYDQDSFNAFCQMLVRVGFGLTFCPYMQTSFWVNALSSLTIGGVSAVKWWNLQCYDGGGGNDPKRWAQGIITALPSFDSTGFILAGDWTNDNPSAVQSLMQGFASEACVGGGFMWTIDQMIDAAPSNPLALMQAYAGAITKGLSG